MDEMIDIDAEVRKLRESRLMQYDDQYLVFEEAAARIMSARNVEHIPLLCQGFDDDTEHHEVMLGLVHAVEEYHKIVAPQLATEQFIRAIPVMLPHASEWAELMLSRFLHNASDRQLLRDSLENAETSDWAISIKLLQKIASDKTGSFQEEAAEVIN